METGDRLFDMIRPIITFLVLAATLAISDANVAQADSYKNFSQYPRLVERIDFYASNRQLVDPFIKPAGETIARLQNLFGTELPKGAIFICSTLEQEDSIYEPKILKMGYGWALTATTPEVRMQEMMERIKSQIGEDIPAEIKERFNDIPHEMLAEAEKQMVDSTTQKIAYAVLQSMMGKDYQYRSSRLNDMGRSSLPDWLDIGIASYASGKTPDLEFLKQNMDQTFPLEDVLLMSRPFVASTILQGYGSSGNGNDMPHFGESGGGMPGGFGGRSGSSGSGGDMPGGFEGGMPGGFGGGMPGGFSGSGGGMGMPPMDFGSRGSGGFSGRGGRGQRGGMQRILPKDEQDQMLFDNQSGTFFCYMLEKVGIEKMRTLVKQVQDGEESLDFITRSDVLGPDMQSIEENWIQWIQSQESPES
jgi:hypothetical protein